MAKMKNNQDGGGANASDPKAAGKSIEKIESKEGAAKYKGSADGHMEGEQKEGAARYKGAHDYDTSKGSHGHDSQGGHGAARMGYAQSFGAARMNGYAKGAAKVTNIMTNGGAAKYMGKGAANKGHGRDDEAHTHKTSGSYGLNPAFGKDAEGKPFGRKSVVGQQAANNLTVTHDPDHKDLGALSRFSNQMYMAPIAGDGAQYPGDALYNIRRRGGDKGSVNRLGETNPGANFFPVKDEDKIKTKVVTASRRDAFDSDGDGDTMFLDSNQDGTMLGRGLMNAYNYFKGKK